MHEQLYKRTAEMDRRIGASVRAVRVAAGMSQSRLASLLGITFQQLQKYESGRNRIAAGTLLLIADALSASVHRFLDGAGQGEEGRGALESVSPEAARLAAAFDRIADPEIRRRILTLVLAVGDPADAPIVLPAALLLEPVATS